MYHVHMSVGRQEESPWDPVAVSRQLCGGHQGQPCCNLQLCQGVESAFELQACPEYSQVLSYTVLEVLLGCAVQAGRGYSCVGGIQPSWG